MAFRRQKEEKEARRRAEEERRIVVEEKRREKMEAKALQAQQEAERQAEEMRSHIHDISMYTGSYSTYLNVYILFTATYTYIIDIHIALMISLCLLSHSNIGSRHDFLRRRRSAGARSAWRS